MSQNHRVLLSSLVGGLYYQLGKGAIGINENRTKLEHKQCHIKIMNKYLKRYHEFIKGYDRRPILSFVCHRPNILVT